MSDNWIQVDGREQFPRNRWREAFRAYITEHLRGHYCPKIAFGSAALCLDYASGGNQYIVHGANESHGTGVPYIPIESALHCTVPTRTNVEYALLRFMEDDHVLILQIWLKNQNGRIVVLSIWKGAKRSFLGYSIS